MVTDKSLPSSYMPPKKAKRTSRPKVKCVDVIVTQRLKLRPSTGPKNNAKVCGAKKTVKYVTHKGDPRKGEVKVKKSDAIKLIKASTIKRKPRKKSTKSKTSKTSKRKACKSGQVRDRKTRRCRKKKVSKK